MGRGGKRAGAGAPKGNLNGFKHGRYSRQYQALLRIIATTPEAIDALREISEHNTRRKNKLRRQAERAIGELLERMEQIESDRRAVEYQLNQSIPPIGWEDTHEMKAKFENAIKTDI